MRPNDIIATLTGFCVSSGALMLAFYAGTQTAPYGQGPLMGAGVLLPIGFVCTWSGLSALANAWRERRNNP